MSGNPFDVLGLDGGADEREVKRAYAKRLKLTDAESDPDAFIALREAYDRALTFVRAGGEMRASSPDVGEGMTSTEGEEAATSAHAPVPHQNAGAEANNPPPVYADEQLRRAEARRRVGIVVDALMRELLDLSDSSNAASAVARTRGQEQLASLEDGENFDQLLAEKLIQVTDLDHCVFLGVADFYNWYDPVQLRYLVDDAVAQQVEKCIFAARLIVALVRNRDEQKATGTILLGPFRPTWFALRVIDTGELDDLMNFVRHYHAIDFGIFRHGPQPLVLDWWLRHGHKPRLSYPKVFFSTLLSWILVTHFVAPYKRSELQLVLGAIILLCIAGITTVLHRSWDRWRKPK